MIRNLSSRRLKNHFHILRRSFAVTNNNQEENLLILGNAARNMLSQQEYILNTISDDDYIKHHPFYLGSSVGGHVRHTLDHWTKLLTHEFTLNLDESIDYDSRERNTEIEMNRLVALTANEKVLHALNSALQFRQLQTPVKVMFIGDAKSGVRYTVDSTFGRELSFVTHHTTHHLSTIKLLMQSMSYDLPSNLGMAYSTVKYWTESDKKK